MLDYTIENLRGMVGFVQMLNSAEYTAEEKHGYLAYAVMHACQAAVLGDSQPRVYGMAIHDYKHVLMRAASTVMNGQPIDAVIANVQEFKPIKPIDWNYFESGLRED